MSGGRERALRCARKQEEKGQPETETGNKRTRGWEEETLDNVVRDKLEKRRRVKNETRVRGKIHNKDFFLSFVEKEMGMEKRR